MVFIGHDAWLDGYDLATGILTTRVLCDSIVCGLARSDDGTTTGDQLYVSTIDSDAVAVR